MSNNKQSHFFADSLNATAQLLFVGGRVLYEMRSSNEERSVSFRNWQSVLRESPELEKTCATDQHMIWVWESLRTAPELRSFFGDLPSGMNPWTSEDELFEVFEPGEYFLIGMTEGEVEKLLKPPKLISEHERVRLQTQERLQMRPGKGHHLECCDCRSEVTITVDKVLSLEREADIMRIEQDRVELGKGYVKVVVDSLNQGYTVASRRLEPQRRSHGGRTYDHLVHIGNEKRTRLENIRQLVESGAWPFSIAAKERRERIEKLFQEPQQWGLRGDPFVWRELRQHFIESGLPETPSDFVSGLESRFKELVGVPLSTEQEFVFSQRYAHGGMSSGQVDPKWWRGTGIPLLQDRIRVAPSMPVPPPQPTNESD